MAYSAGQFFVGFDPDLRDSVAGFQRCDLLLEQLQQSLIILIAAEDSAEPLNTFHHAKECLLYPLPGDISRSFGS
jgi:hypothetical protein